MVEHPAVNRRVASSSLACGAKTQMFETAHLGFLFTTQTFKRCLHPIDSRSH